MTPLFDRDESGWILSWLGLGVAAVVLNEYPGAGPFVRYTLLAIIAYVLLTNAEVFGPPIARWVARLGGAGVPVDGSTAARTGRAVPI